MIHQLAAQLGLDLDREYGLARFHRRPRGFEAVTPRALQQRSPGVEPHQHLHRDVIRFEPVQFDCHFKTQAIAIVYFRLHSIQTAYRDVRPRLAYAYFPLGNGARIFVLVLFEQAMLFAGGQITLGKILAHHALGVEARHDGRHRAFGHFYPVLGKPHLAMLVVQRHDLILQQLVKGTGFFAGTDFFAQEFRYRFDRPAILAVVALSPPAVQHRQVDNAVQPCFHAGGTAGFQWVERIVQPYIDA